MYIFFFTFVGTKMRQLDSMEIKQLNSLKPINDEFEFRKLFSSPTIDFMHLIIKPSEIIDRQTHPFKSIFFVVSGKGIVEAGMERKVVEENTIIEIEANQEIGWINAKEENLVLIFLKLKA